MHENLADVIETARYGPRLGRLKPRTSSQPRATSSASGLYKLGHRISRR